jgi:outer membrane protein assembly factor BamD
MIGARIRVSLSLLLLVIIAGCGGSVLPQIHSETERLEVARRMMRDKDYVQAIELLKTYVANNVGSADVDEALYLLGESELKIKDWTAAQLDFERLLRDYPESDSSAAGLFRFGEAYYGQARGPDFDQEYTEKALEQWDRYKREFPDHWLQPEADRKIAEARSRLAAKYLKNGRLYMKLKLPEPARVYFLRVVNEFPESPQAADATIELALAEEQAGLKQEAIDRLRRVEETFPGKPIASRAAYERRRIEKK